VSAPPAPEPDTKDWTWVLHRRCPDCGFDAPGVAVADVPAALTAAVATLRGTLARPDAASRGDPEVWSPLEYACHVRDVCIVYGTRLALLRAKADPDFADWDQDATALAERYWEQDPARVSDELAVEAERLAAAFGSVRADEYTRSGRRSDGASFTIEALARYFLHDVVHHVHDVQRG
jgi:hypothetical protein